MTPTRHDHGNKAAFNENKIINSPSTINNLLISCSNDFIGSENITMLQADIVALERRQQILECEIVEALRDRALDDSMIANLKSRILFVREQIETLRQQADIWWH
jgi:hypothetical protein